MESYWLTVFLSNDYVDNRHGDFVPTSTYSKLFTIVYALMSIGVFVAVVSKLVSIILQQKRYLTVKRKKFVDSHGLKHKPKPVTDKLKKTDDDTE